MASAKNMVIAGDYMGCFVGCVDDAPYIKAAGYTVPLNISQVEAYQLVTEEKAKSLTSGIIRGSIGGLLFGPLGLLGGALLAKNDGVYNLSVQFKDGRRSLLEVDERRYKALVKNCF